ncbi:MAG: hypothetical protein HY690_04460 [Chloroflexi bacterium]|nr:hypothetical protein [Chloroflexota bacterium]
MRCRSFDLHSLLTSRDEFFRQKAEGKGLALRVEWAGEAPRCVQGDEGNLRAGAVP